MKRVFLDTNILMDAIEYREAMAFGPVKDFEDMMQYQCAKAAGCDVIVTNNKRDFHAFCELPFLTSEEFLLEFDFE